MFRGSKSRRQPLVLKRAARRGGRPVFFSAFKQCSTTIQKSIIHRKSLHNSMIERRQKNQAYSCGLLGLTPPCHLSAAATPHARRAQPLSKKLSFLLRAAAVPSAEARRAKWLCCGRSFHFPPLPIGKFSVLPRLSFWALVCLRLLHIAAASARCQPFPSGNPRLPSSSSRFVLIQLFSFFFGLRLRLMVSAPRQKLRLLSALHFAVLESVSQREPSESRPLHCVLPSPKHLPTMFRPHPPTLFRGVLL